MKSKGNNRSGNLRLRKFYPLSGHDGAYNLIYDLERTFILEIPADLQTLITHALESRQIDEKSKEWLEGEDLLTSQSYNSWAESKNLKIPQVTDISIDLSGACNMECEYCFERDINSRIGPMSVNTAMTTMDFVFKITDGAKHIVLHFGSGEPLMHFDLLRKIVEESSRRAGKSGQHISFELTTNATMVTHEIASFLCDYPFNVRVSCDGPPRINNRLRPLKGGRDSYAIVENGLNILLEYLRDRVTVNSVMTGGTTLSVLWEWAKALDIRHYHIIKVGAYSDDQLNILEKELSGFKEDLKSVCNEMFADLEAGNIPIDFQPVTKIVRRLMIPQPITRFCGVAGSYLGVASDGKVFPCFRHSGVTQYLLGDVWQKIDDNKRSHYMRHEAADVDNRPICQDCWARYLCGGGCYADSAVYGTNKLKPQLQHCHFWCAEIETGIRFYNKLLRTDPSYCTLLFGDDIETVLGSLESSPNFLKSSNCS